MGTQRYFKALVTRDTTESALIPVAAENAEQAGAVATSRDTELAFNSCFASNDASMDDYPYLGDPEEDVVEITEAEYMAMLRDHALNASATEPLLSVDNIMAAASAHAESGEPDHEVGDLQSVLRAAWELMTLKQRQQLCEHASVKAVFEDAYGDSDGMTPQ